MVVKIIPAKSKYSAKFNFHANTKQTQSLYLIMATNYKIKLEKHSVKLRINFGEGSWLSRGLRWRILGLVGEGG